MNTSIQDELNYLLGQHLNNRLTPAERARFLDLLRQEEHRRLLAGKIEELLNHPGPASWDGEVNKQQLFEKVISEAALRQVGHAELTAGSSMPDTAAGEVSHQQSIPRESTPREASPRIRTRRHYYSAAAAILLIILTTFIYHNKKPASTTGPIAATPKPARHPANQVLLTLADGSQVPLDSMQKGTLVAAQKQGADIVKTGDGDITYKAVAASGATANNTITTPRGGQYHITLPDGSQVWLNAASSLQFPVAFTGKQRSVVLTGEGYFEVAKDPSRPFTVEVVYPRPTRPEGMKINVLGTHFNIMAYSNEENIKTTLLEGSVQLSNRTERMILRPGQQGSAASSAESFRLSTPNIQEIVAWKNGEFRFENTPVTAIMRQIERWYDLSVSYEGNIADLTLSGVISRKEDVTQLMDILEATHKVHFRLNNDRLIVMPYENKGQ